MFTSDDNKIISDIFKKEFSTETFSISKLTGDASDREYYRAIFPNGDSVEHSVIIMKIHDVPIDSNIPYINIQKFLSKFLSNIPAIYTVFLEKGIIILEDFGDTTLEDLVKTDSKFEMVEIYKKSIDILIKMQVEGLKNRDENCIAFSFAFDVDKFMWEFNFFLENVIQIYLSKKIIPEDMECIQENFLKISKILANEHRYFTHRDYHSRNLMVRDNGEIGILDFQDARLGLLQYDLVSLLKDSYIELDGNFIEDMIKYYLEVLEKEKDVVQNYEHFRKIFNYMSIQRNLKAAGSFAYLDCIKGKNRYLQYLPRTLKYVKETFGNNISDFEHLYRVLGHYINEFN